MHRCSGRIAVRRSLTKAAEIRSGWRENGKLKPKPSDFLPTGILSIPRSWFEAAAATAFDMTAKADVCCRGNVLKKAPSCACVTLDRSLRFPRWRTAAFPLTARSFYRAADPDG